MELAKKGLSNLTKDEKEIATKQLEFKEAKKANSGTTLNEFTSDMSASEKKEAVKKYVADDYKEMSGSEIQEASYRDWETDRKSTRLNSSHRSLSRMPSSA